MSNDEFVNSIITKQERVRDDIRSLGDAVEQQGYKIDSVLELLQRVVQFQEEENERGARQANIAEDVTKIASSVVGLVEDMHSQNRLLTGLLEKLDKRLSAESTLDYVLTRMEKEE